MIVLNERIKSVLKKSGILLIIFIIAIYAWTVYSYGNFNIFASPHRIIIKEFRYDNDNHVVELTGNEKTMNEVSGILDKLTGKRIYSVEKNFVAGYGTRVFLHIKDSKYILLQCGGGA